MSQKTVVSLMDVGERIAQLRNNIGLSQDELVERMGISNRSKLAMWERGERNFKAEDLQRFAEFFNTTVDYLLTGTEALNVGVFRETGLSDKAIEALKRFKESDHVEGDPTTPAGKCAALSVALSSPALLELISSLMRLKATSRGHFDSMMPDAAGEFYEGLLSPDTYAAALGHRLILTIERLRKGEGGELPEYEPWVKRVEQVAKQLRQERKATDGASIE